MAYQYGVMTDVDSVDLKAPVNDVGQQVIYDDLERYLDKVEADTQAAQTLFVQEDTELYTESYEIPGGSGRMQRRGAQTSVGTVKTAGKYDVGYPLEDFADGLGWNDIDIAYMSMREFNKQVSLIEDRNRNTIRYEMLKALFTNTTRTFIDVRLKTPTITVQPLANGDTVTYPPLAGVETPAIEDHYLVTGYTVASVSNTNNPVATSVGELNEHFGDSGTGENNAYFAGKTLAAKLMTLTDFYEVDQKFIVQGITTDRVSNVPTNLPGIVRGRMKSGAWLVEWAWIPDDYGVTISLDAPAPLKRRIDPAFTGLPSGLRLVATDQHFPFTASYWRNRYGFGVGNRLNGVVQKFAASGAYSVPSVYA